MSTVFALSNTTRKNPPRIHFERIAREILGTRYHVSLVLCGDSLSQRLNKQYRQKTYIPNVLSFKLGATDGEIFLNVREATREAHREKMSLEKEVAFLFIHACLHLKGFSHSDRMDRLEDRYLKRAGF